MNHVLRCLPVLGLLFTVAAAPAAVVVKTLNIETPLGGDSGDSVHFAISPFADGASDVTINYQGTSSSAATTLSMFNQFGEFVYANAFGRITGGTDVIFNASTVNDGGIPALVKVNPGDVISVAGNDFFGRTGSGLLPAEPVGDWTFGEVGYTSFRLDIGADSYYGWAEISTNSSAQITLYRLGIETSEGQSITVPNVPEPGTYAALLALAVMGLAVRQRLKGKK